MEDKGTYRMKVSRTVEMIEAVDNAIPDTFPDLNVKGLRRGDHYYLYRVSSKWNPEKKRSQYPWLQT